MLNFFIMMVVMFVVSVFIVYIDGVVWYIGVGFRYIELVFI